MNKRENTGVDNAWIDSLSTLLYTVFKFTYDYSLSTMQKTALPQLSLLLFLLFICGQVKAEEIKVAVASNFANTLAKLVTEFERDTQHQVTLIIGSTGKHYAQIMNGAPFDAFFAADSVRPQLLEKNGKTVSNSRFTYAVGKIVLWDPNAGESSDILLKLKQGEFRFLAIANPKLAPYGKAAQQVISALELESSLGKKIVRGENIAQTYQFVKSGNAELGFVALSQIIHEPIEGIWQPSQMLYTPIEQQAVLLSQSIAAKAFIDFVQTEEAQAIIRVSGYDSYGDNTL